MPVLTNEDNRVLGTVTISDLVKLYDKEVEKIVKIRKDNSHISLSARNESDSSDANQNQKSKETIARIICYGSYLYDMIVYLANSRQSIGPERYSCWQYTITYILWILRYLETTKTRK